ncbi:MAG: 50S ribosomal protein L31 [Mycoplasmatales bacterium]
MKKDIHLQYQTTKIVCSCGNEFEVQSTKDKMNVESCNQCHPAYTGKSKNVSAAGRVDKFNKKFGLETN